MPKGQDYIHVWKEGNTTKPIFFVNKDRRHAGAVNRCFLNLDCGETKWWREDTDPEGRKREKKEFVYLTPSGQAVTCSSSFYTKT